MANPLDIPQNFSTTLNVGGGINSSQTTGIIATSVTGLPTDGGILAFDWANPIDTTTIEYIEYTGITGNEFTGVTRGQEGVTAKAHSNGATIVGVVSRAHIKRLRDKLTGNDAVALQDPNGNEILKSSYVASAVNEITTTNAATGNGPSIAATGGDSNIDLNITPKGTGKSVITSPKFTFGTNATGDIFYRSSGGEVARLAIGSTGQFLKVAAGLPSWGINISVKVGSTTYDSSTTGSLAVTGVGFTPKLMLVLLSYTGSSSAGFSIGWTDGTTSGNFQQTNTGNTNQSNELAVLWTTYAGTNAILALSSFDSDGFTLTKSKNGSPTGTATVTYLCIG